MRIPLGRTLSLTALVILAAAWKIASAPVDLAPESRLWVAGTSTVKSFTCKADSITAKIVAADQTAPHSLLAGVKTISGVTFDVTAARLECGNGTMNSHMLKALKASEYPSISFKLDSYELAKGSDSTAGTLSGTLNLGGVEKPVVLAVALKDVGPGAVRVTGEYELNMRDYQLKPPSLMLGTMKVREKVKVGFDLLLKS